MNNMCFQDMVTIDKQKTNHLEFNEQQRREKADQLLKR